MADLTVTPANVIPQSGAVLVTGTSGAAIAAGDLLYKDSSDSDKLKLCTTATAAAAACVGVAVNSAPGAGQPVTYMTDGRLAMGAILTASTAYGVSDNAGKIRPLADNGSGDQITQIGLAESTTILHVKINARGVTV